MFPESQKEDNRLSKENLRLKSAVEELSILNDIAIAIAYNQSLDQITKLIIKKCVKYLKAQQGAIQLVDEKDTVNPFHTMIRVREKLSDKTLRFNKIFTDLIIAQRKSIMINKFKAGEHFELNDKSDIRIKSLLSVPMIIKGKMIGILSLFNKESDEGFTDADQRLLSIIASQSAHVIENSRLFEEEKQLLQIQQELKVARDIQKNLLPKEIPQINGYDIYAINIPAQEVGGDYYDFIKISESKTAIALGYVSGKGLPAAMLMANLQATLRGQLLFCDCAKECLKRANNLLYKSTDITKFVTLFFGILDSEKHTLTYCNAGHNNPIFLQRGKKTELDKGGILLSCMEDTNYDEEVIQFEEGSTLAVFSDGITEAMNEKEEEFGSERFIKTLLKNKNESSRNIIENILKIVHIHAGNAIQSDDITALVVKRNI
jgi:sigma-B regulation protein RsbU (phosphoserine phosphatase)